MLTVEADASAVNEWDTGQKIAEFQSPGQCSRHQTEAVSIIQTVCQRLDQPEETKKCCSSASDINSVVQQLCEVTNCEEFYTEGTTKVSVQIKSRLKVAS